MAHHSMVSAAEKIDLDLDDAQGHDVEASDGPEDPEP